MPAPGSAGFDALPGDRANLGPPFLVWRERFCRGGDHERLKPGSVEEEVVSILGVLNLGTQAGPGGRRFLPVPALGLAQLFDAGLAAPRVEGDQVVVSGC